MQQSEQKEQRSAVDKTDKKKAIRILNDLDKQSLAVNPDILEVGNLSFETMAQYKALLMGDICVHDQIT